MARNSALSGENSELKQLLIYANRDLEGNVAYIAYLKKQLKEKASWVY